MVYLVAEKTYKLQPQYYAWYKAPFLRILPPFAAGIVIEWYQKLPPSLFIAVFACALSAVILLRFQKLSTRYFFGFVNGISLQLMLASLGCGTVYVNDDSRSSEALAKKYKGDETVEAVIQETLIEKANSFKAESAITYLFKNDSAQTVKGKIIIYFAKDSFPSLDYGSVILFKKQLQPIRNSGNPGAFDYKRYCHFQNIYYQVYLKSNEFIVLPGKIENPFYHFLFRTRAYVVSVLSNFIPDEKEAGLAEAILIGYKNDLDKDLVQEYTSAGVVHVIAISGLHIGIIYWMLAMLLFPLKIFKKGKVINAMLVIAGLCLFGLLAGAGPSVMRSVIMFSCMVIGKAISRNTYIINSLASSAFLLLCIDPFWLWDIGFQLSYAAVLSIVIFYQPIYHWFYLPNRIMNKIWQMCSITFAAQVFTTPISIFHFHQFPNYFFLANFLAVPLSTLVVIGEILICAFSFFPLIAHWCAVVTIWMIKGLNTFIAFVNSLPYSVTDGLLISFTQFLFITACIACTARWLLNQSKNAFFASLFFLLLFVGERSASLVHTSYQQKIIVYNTPKKTAIDLIKGNAFVFIGDSSFLNDDYSRNFYLKPTRIALRLDKAEPSLAGNKEYTELEFCDRTVLIVSKNCVLLPNVRIDLLILSRNPKIYLKSFLKEVHVKQIVADGSNPYWKINYWRKDCAELNIPFHDVQTDGAFVWDLRN